MAHLHGGALAQVAEGVRTGDCSVGFDGAGLPTPPNDADPPVQAGPSSSAIERSGQRLLRSRRLTRLPEECQKGRRQTKTATSLRPPSLPIACGACVISGGQGLGRRISTGPDACAKPACSSLEGAALVADTHRRAHGSVVSLPKNAAPESHLAAPRSSLKSRVMSRSVSRSSG